jgi:hypothetical protein
LEINAQEDVQVSIEPKTPIELLLAKHLPYELDMLDQTLARLLKNQDEPVVRNALIESFWTHVRNLVEFFTQKKDDGLKGTASAQDMTEGYFADTKLKKMDQLINQQISHLQYDRPAFTKDQLHHTEMFRVRGVIEREVENFQKKICKKYHRFWKIRMQRKDIDKELWLSFMESQPFATNVLQVIGPTNLTPTSQGLRP